MRIVAINNLGYEPWDLEMKTAGELGADFAVLSYDEFRASAETCDVIINGGGWPLPPDLLDRVDGCRLIVGFGTGTDWIDLEDASRRGIIVANTPLANVEDVATHTLALLLACVRRVAEFDHCVRNGRFDSTAVGPMHRLGGRKLGLLSFGNVPRRLCELVRPFALSVRAFDPFVSAEVMAAFGVERRELEPLLRSTDILSVHTPANKNTIGFVNEERLRMLPRGAIVIITSRGAVYDSRALAGLLREGHLAGAGLDVFPDEPVEAGDPLLDIGTAVLTPHVAGDSVEAVNEYHAAASAALVEHAAGRMPAWVLNAARDARAPSAHPDTLTERTQP